MRNQIIQGDALAILKTLSTHSVESIVCDPPSGISFGNAAWDSDKGGRDQWIAWLCEIFFEARRVIKPGGHAFVWALPRTAHWTTTAIEDAGWEIRGKCYHLFGSGLPKSHHIGKAIDRMKGAEREVLHQGPVLTTGNTYGKINANFQQRTITAPATPEAIQYDGWGTGLKPAVEEWILVRAPLAESTVAANVLEWGTGALNIDACRVSNNRLPPEGVGRWPSNLLLTHSFECSTTGCVDDCPILAIDQQSGISTSKPHISYHKGERGNAYGKMGPRTTYNLYNDRGGASRYFQQFYYANKASKAERNAGCEALPAKEALDFHHSHIDGWGQPYETTPNTNHHPTVKNLSLMRHLCRTITPTGGLCLDMFAGSGSTLVACVQEGFDFIGIEQLLEYVEIAKARVKHAQAEAA